MEENKNYITYDENWQSVSQPEYPVVSEPSDEDSSDYNDAPKQSRKKSNYPKQYLAALQLAACVLLAAAALVLKSFGGELYETVRNWYYTQLESSAIFDGNNGFDINALLNSASADEI